MNAIRAQFACSFAVFGCIVPYLSAFLEQERGFTHAEVGEIAAWSGVAMLFSPNLITLLADTRVDPRKIIGVIYGITGGILGGLYLADGFIPLALLLTAYYLVMAPIGPLQDSVNFSEQARALTEKRRAIPYHFVRVWGTAGFMVPSAIMWFLQERGAPLDRTLVLGMVFCLCGVVVSFFLPETRAKDRPVTRHRLPTWLAAKIFITPGMPTFTLALFLANAAANAFYAYYPVYLSDVAGLDNAWLGPMFNLGVAIEIFYMLGYGPLQRAFGTRGLAVFCALATAARLLLLAIIPTVPTLVGTQLVHGLLVLLVNVIAPVYVNQRAGQEFRASAQGVYNVLVPGFGRIAGSWFAAHLAATSLTRVFHGATALLVAAMILLWWSFRTPGENSEKDVSAKGGI